MIMFLCKKCNHAFLENDGRVEEKTGLVTCKECESIDLLVYDGEKVENTIMRLVLQDEDGNEVVGYDFVSTPWRILDEKFVESIAASLMKEHKIPLAGKD